MCCLFAEQSDLKFDVAAVASRISVHFVLDESAFAS